jgi:hypothetical protein
MWLPAVLNLILNYRLSLLYISCVHKMSHTDIFIIIIIIIIIITLVNLYLTDIFF